MFTSGHNFSSGVIVVLMCLVKLQISRYEINILIGGQFISIAHKLAFTTFCCCAVLCISQFAIAICLLRRVQSYFLLIPDVIGLGEKLTV